ncbi:hypothetical protein D3C75_1263720 [compost metagenome]
MPVARDLVVEPTAVAGPAEDEPADVVVEVGEVAVTAEAETEAAPEPPAAQPEP